MPFLYSGDPNTLKNIDGLVLRWSPYSGLVQPIPNSWKYVGNGRVWAPSVLGVDQLVYVLCTGCTLVPRTSRCATTRCSLDGQHAQSPVCPAWCPSGMICTMLSGIHWILTASYHEIKITNIFELPYDRGHLIIL